jgi:hypothetical protein
MIASLNMTAAALASLACMGATVSAPPVAVPHIDPVRVLPTEPHSPVEDSDWAPEIDEDWFEDCLPLGSCADLGRSCPPTHPGDEVGEDGLSLGTAVWCDSTAPRGRCEGWALTDCVQISQDAYCGREWKGTCVYQSNGAFDRIHPGTIVATGNWCAGSGCTIEP